MGDDYPCVRIPSGLRLSRFFPPNRCSDAHFWRWKLLKLLGNQKSLAEWIPSWKCFWIILREQARRFLYELLQSWNESYELYNHQFNYSTEWHIQIDRIHQVCLPNQRQHGSFARIVPFETKVNRLHFQQHENRQNCLYLVKKRRSFVNSWLNKV